VTQYIINEVTGIKPAAQEYKILTYSTYSCIRYCMQVFNLTLPMSKTRTLLHFHYPAFWRCFILLPFKSQGNLHAKHYILDMQLLCYN